MERERERTFTFKWTAAWQNLNAYAVWRGRGGGRSRKLSAGNRNPLSRNKGLATLLQIDWIASLATNAAPYHLPSSHSHYPLHLPPASCSFMPQARASNTSNMLTPISRHPAAHAACCTHCCLLPPASCLLLLVAWPCCRNLIARPWLQRDSQQTARRTPSGAGAGAAGPATLKAIPLMWMRPCGRGGRATVVRRLVQHFSITSLCNVFC